MNIMKFVIKLIVCYLTIFHIGVCEAAFESVANHNLPTISIGIVKSYGDYTVMESLFYSFKEMLRENMQYSKMFRLVEDYSGTIMIKNQEVAVDEFFSVLLMDSIVRSNRFSSASVGPTVRQFAKLRGIHPNVQKNSNVYSLSVDYFNVLRNIRCDKQCNYLLLCNIQDAEFNVENAPLGSKIGSNAKFNISYYLIKVDDNKVFEGCINDSIEDGTFRKFFSSGIKQTDAPLLYQILFDVVSKKVVSELETKALPALTGKMHE